MNAAKKQIMSELDSLPDQKAYSLLDYLHFLKEEKEYIPNEETMEAVRQADRDIESLKGYSSAEEIFEDLDIN